MRADMRDHPLLVVDAARLHEVGDCLCESEGRLELLGPNPINPSHGYPADEGGNDRRGRSALAHRSK